MKLASFVFVLAIACALASPALAQPVDITWTEIVPPRTRARDGHWARFVEIDGEHIVVSGPGFVDVYRWDGEAATFDASLVATSGDSGGWGNEPITLDDGRVVVVAREVAVPPPALYIFSNASGSWAQVARMSNPVADGGDPLFGDLVMNRTRLLASVPYANTGRGFTSLIRADASGAFAWTVPRESRVTGSTNYELSGSSIDMNGDRVLIGTIRSPAGGFSQTGRIGLYRDTGSALTLDLAIDNPTPGTDDQFGSSVRLIDDGFVVAARYDDTATTNAGALYVFDASGALVQTIYGPTSPANPMLGHMMDADEDWIVASAPTYLRSGTGSFFLYRRDAGGTYQQRERVMTLGSSGDGFSEALALHGNVIVVGADAATVTGTTGAGRAWVGVITEPDGGRCDADAECTNGHCVDGICCNTTCGGACDVCGTGTCITMTCDAGTPDASTVDASADVDADVDASIQVDASTDVDATTDVDARSSLDGATNDASAEVDAGGTNAVPRVPLSCTCRAGAPSSSRGALVWLAISLATLVARRRR